MLAICAVMGFSKLVWEGTMGSAPVMVLSIPYDLAIVSYPRNRSFLCTTLRSVMHSARPATVTVFHGRRASTPSLQRASQCWLPPSNTTIHEVVMAPDFGVLDAYFAVTAAVVDGTLPWMQPHHRGLMVVEDDVLFEREFDHSLQVILNQIDPHNIVSKPLMLHLYEGLCCGTYHDLARQVNESSAHGVIRPARAEPGWRWGSQAYYFQSIELLSLLVKHLNETRHSFVGLQDMFVWGFGETHKMPMWAVVGRSLVQHIGAISTLFDSGVRFHASTSFPGSFSEFEGAARWGDDRHVDSVRDY